MKVYILKKWNEVRYAYEDIEAVFLDHDKAVGYLGDCLQGDRSLTEGDFVLEEYKVTE